MSRFQKHDWTPAMMYAAKATAYYKLDDGWTIEESIEWGASKYAVAIDDLKIALAVEMAKH